MWNMSLNLPLQLEQQTKREWCIKTYAICKIMESHLKQKNWW
jgi:hypothetical protein